MTETDLIKSLAMISTACMPNRLRNEISDRIVKGQHDAKSLAKAQKALDEAASIIEGMLAKDGGNTAELRAAAWWLQTHRYDKQGQS